MFTVVSDYRRYIHQSQQFSPWMSLMIRRRIPSPWPHCAGQTLVYLYHVIKFSPVYLEALEGPSRLYVRCEGLITPCRVGAGKDQHDYEAMSFFHSLAPAQTRSIVVDSISTCYGIWWCDGCALPFLTTLQNSARREGCVALDSHILTRGRKLPNPAVGEDQNEFWQNVHHDLTLIGYY